MDANKKIEELLADLDAAWSFNDVQCHTHTWHDKQDFLEKWRKELSQPPQGGEYGELDDKALWKRIDDLLGEAAKRFGEARGAADALGAQGWDILRVCDDGFMLSFHDPKNRYLGAGQVHERGKWEVRMKRLSPPAPLEEGEER